MVFSSHIFLFYFLPIFLVTYYGLYWGRASIQWLNLTITLFSYFFYGWFEPWFVTLMWVSTIVDYGCGKLIAAPGASKFQRNTGLVISLISNLSLLGFFKYYMFAMSGINKVVELFGGGEHYFYVMSIILPIGISFYTFQTLSYSIDVWRGDAPPVKDLRTFSCFVASFPQLIAGPIIRYNTVAEQLAERSHSINKFTRGAIIFSLGMGKKIILANSAGKIADNVFAAQAPDWISSWWGVIAYSFQIYFDFSAYSDMAFGLGLMLGFYFTKNFNAPYHAENITDFWRRWHISLTRWFRDYLYISLGGNRVKSAYRLYFNLFVVMFLSGLWHGAQMTFVAWGLFHAFFLILERYLGKPFLYNRLPKVFRTLITFILVLFSWVLFRATDLGHAWSYWGSMLFISDASAAAPLLHSVIFKPADIFWMLICAFFVWQPFQALDWSRKLTPARMLVSLFVLIFSVMMMFSQSFNPFLYFQF